MQITIKPRRMPSPVVLAAFADAQRRSARIIARCQILEAQGFAPVVLTRAGHLVPVATHRIDRHAGVARKAVA